ncbi:YncE family protein [Longimicrobium sp.]|jgi:YVTN family beta-propeller protein|uniref:YncE family protein n=1 Tax=Longimicrobium sp. TaxID=2029185 RepID=UPI002ED77CB4
MSASFNDSCFSCLNDKAQPPALVVYSTTDTTWNSLTFTLVNNTGTDLTLTGGVPVNGTQEGGASSFAFDFSTILTDAQASAMQVGDAKGEWEAVYFPPGDHGSPTWAVAPRQDFPFANGSRVDFKLRNIACTSQTPGAFDVLFYNVPGVAQRTFPFSYLVAVLNPPQGDDLKKVLDCGVLNGTVQHVIQPASNPPAGDSGAPPIPVYITYDNTFPIQNSLTVYLENNSSHPLVPSGTPLGGAVFTFSFLFGTDDDAALTTQALGDQITIGVDPDSPSKWSSTAHQAGTGNWIFTPGSPPLIAANQGVRFPIGNIITDLNVAPQTLSSLHVQWNFVPGYADGYFSIELQKQVAVPSIPASSFQVVPATIKVGDNVVIAYQTEVAAYVTLVYALRDGNPVNLASPTDIGFDEGSYVPPRAPDRESTVFTLSVYKAPGEAATDTKTFSITVIQPPAVISSFTASSLLVNINGANVVTLSWQVQDAKTIEVVDHGIQTGTSLSVTVNGTTTYTLKATPWGTDGQPVYASLTVYAYKAYASVNVGSMGNGTAFQSLPISISNPSNSIVYVANAAAGAVYQVLQATHAVSPTTFPGNILALTQDGLKLFTAQAGGSGPGTIYMFDAASQTQVASLQQQGPPPYSLAINPAGTQMYYLQQHQLTTVSAYNVSEGGNSFAYVQDITVGTSPEAYAFDAAGANLYVGNYDSQNVSVISLAQNAVTATIGLQSTEPCAFALVGTILFVACSGDNLVCVIDTTTNSTLDPITAGFQPFSLTLDQNKARLFVTNFQGGTVTVIDTASRTVTATLTVGSGPSAARITDSGNLLFVSNYCDKSLSVVDISNGGATVVGSITLEQTNGNPIDIATYGVNNNYTDVFVSKEYFLGRNNGCSGSQATDANLNMSIFSIQEKGS